MKRFKIFRMTGVLSLVLIMALLMAGCGGADKIVVGSKDFGESIVLSEIFAQLIEAKTDLTVDRKLNMGGTFVCFEAIKNGDIDIYPEYTGTALTAQLGMDVITDPDEAYRTVSNAFDEQFGIRWLEPLGLNNTYTISVSDAVYQEYGIETFSDLAEISENLIFGAEHEFFDRQDGYDGLTAAYNMTFKGDPQKMNISLKYQAIGNGDIDVTDSFATDGEIIQYNLHVLKDDKGFFPPYYASPIIRNDTLEAHPELEEILNLLAGMIDDDTMIELNYKVSVQGQEADAVAAAFLQERGLI